MQLAVIAPATSVRAGWRQPRPHIRAIVPARVESPDGELIARVADGDRDAFEELYRRYARPVFALALRRLRDRGQAEDAVQETFTSIWRSASSYRPERGPGAPWLYTVARNAVVDRLRSQARAVPFVAESPGSEAGPEEQAELGWTAWQVHRAIEALPESEREVLQLAYWKGLSQSEVADSLGIPLGTVKTRTRSGLSRLAGLLEQEDVA